MGKRIEYVDIAKFIAVTSVIFGHKLLSLTALFFPFHLPIFFIIAGYFISEKSNVKEFVKRKLVALIIPYFFTCLIICLLSIPLSLLRGNSVISELERWTVASLYGLGHDTTFSNGIHIPQIGAIWFLWGLFFAIIIVRLIIMADKMIQILITILLSGVAIISSAFIWLPLSIQSAFLSVPFIYVGYLLKVNKDSIDKFFASNKVAVISFCSLVAIWGYLNYSGFSINSCKMNKGVIDLIVACADSTLIILLSEQIHLRFSTIARIFEHFGKMTIVMLSVHIVELNLFPWEKLTNLMGISDIEVAQVVIAVVSYSAILIATFIIGKIPLLRKIYGLNGH